MKNKILISVSIIIIVILSIISINEIKKRSKETSDNEFVKKYLNYLNNGDIEIDFTDVTLYFKSEKIYLEIVYEYKYKEYQGTQRFLANKLTDQFVQGGFENSYPEFIIEFNDVKINHSRKKTYSKKEIKNLLDK